MKNNLLKLFLLVIFSLTFNNASAQLAQVTYKARLAYVRSNGESYIQGGSSDWTAFVSSWDNINDVRTSSNCQVCDNQEICIYGINVDLQTRTNTADRLYGIIDAWEESRGGRCDFNTSQFAFPKNCDGYRSDPDIGSYNFRLNSYPTGSTTYSEGNVIGYTNEHSYVLSCAWYYSGLESLIVPTCAVQTASYGTGGPRSWSVNLTAGVSYNFNKCDGTGNYTQIAIFGSDGYTRVMANNEPCGSLSQLNFTPLTTGTYYIEISKGGQLREELTSGGVLSYKINAASPPTATTPVNYPISFIGGPVALPLTATVGANGTGLLWYDVATGGVGSSTAPIPSRIITGPKSYWVSSINSNGCESTRTQIVVNIVNQPPTDITMNNSSINENVPPNTAVAQLFTTESDLNNIYNYTYVFVAGAGDTDNAAFTLSGNYLKINARPDFEVKSSYNFRIRSTDPGGLSIEKQFTFLINDIDETPGAYLNFDGVDDVVSIPNFQRPQNMTIECWLKTTNNNLKTILNWFGTSGFGDYYLGMNQGKIIYTENKGSASPASGSSTTAINNDDWHHVAITRTNATTNNLKIYIDGNLETTFTSTNNFATTSMELGRDGYSNTTRLFEGSIDELRIWDITKTGDQIVRSKNCELQGTETGLISYYQFNQGFAAGDNLASSSLIAKKGSNGILYNFARTGTSSNFLSGTDIPVTNGSVIPSVPIGIVTETYNQGNPANTLTATVGANGSGLLWYNTSTSTPALTVDQLLPSTATAGSRSYWVSSVNTNGCESDRVQKVIIILPNTAPTNIALSATSINENTATNSLVGVLSTTDSNTANTFTYSLVSGTGGNDNSLFFISGSDLKLTVSPNFEVKNSYNVRIKTTDQGGLSFTKPFVVTINNVPESIALSATAIDENIGANAVVSTLNVTDSNTGNSFTYTLVSGTGDTDSTSFSISGSNLRIIPNPNFETKSSYSIRVKATEQGSLTFEKEFVITINDLVETAATHLNFDGTNDYVSVPHFARPQTMTVEAWIKSGVTTQQTIAGWGGTNTAEFKIQANTLAYYESTSTNSAVSAPLPSDNNWHHVAVTRTNAATNNVKLYVDGLNVATGTVNLNITTSTFDIGAINTTARQFYFNGSLDEVRVWSVVRTPSEIFGSRSCELNNTENGLISYYKFNQGAAAGNNYGVTTLTATRGSVGTLNNFAKTGTTSNFLLGSSVTSGSVIPEVPTVVSPISYIVGSTASALTATVGVNGTGLVWYDSDTTTTALTVAQQTPSTAIIGSKTYWVASTNANGCQSAREQVVVNVVSVNNTATHLDFNSVNDYISLGNVIPANSSYTKELMIKSGSFFNNDLLKSSNAYLRFGSNNIRAGHISASSFIQYDTAYLQQAAYDWMHIAVTYDVTTLTLKLYVNGILRTEANNYPSVGVQDITIGSIIADQSIQGSIDEVRIWTVARTAEQIFGSKNCELQGGENGLTAYYQFNQGVPQGNNIGVLTAIAKVGTNATLSNFALTGTTSNFLSSSPINTGSIIPSAPTVTTPVNYNLQATVSQLSATIGTNGVGLAWYSSDTSTTALTGSELIPSTAAVGTTVYWVASTNANGCQSTRKQVVINIINVNVAPKDIILSNDKVDNNIAANSLIGALSSVDANAGDSFTYTLVSGIGATDNASFSINGANLRISVSPNFKIKNSYSIRVRSTDQTGLFFEKQFIILVKGPADHLHFDGDGDNVAIPYSSNFNFGTGDFTVETWYKKTNGNFGGTQVALGAIQASSSFWIGGDTSRFTFAVSGSASAELITPLTADRWYHLAGVRKNGVIYLYVDGVLRSQVNNNSNLVFTTSSISMGNFNGGFNFLGAMDEARVWNVARSADQIFGSKNCELQGNETGLISYYKFNQGVTTGDNTAITLLTATTGSDATLNNFTKTGPVSNFLMGSPVTAGSIIPSVATVITPINYAVGATPTAVTAILGAGGNSLAWYSSNTSTTPLTNAQLTPSTATPNATSYWVASVNANGCQSERTEVAVYVNSVNTTPTNIALSSNILDNNVAVNTLVGALSTTDANFGNTFTYELVSGAGDIDNVTFNINGANLTISVSPDFLVKSSYTIRVRSTDQGGLSFEKEFTILIKGPGSHLNFDGVDDNIAIPYSNAFFFGTGNFTVETMVKTTSTSGPKVAIGNTRTLSGNTYSFWLGVENGKPVFSIEGSTNIQGTTAISDDQWHHLVGVRNNGVSYLYVDGVLIGQVNNSTNLLFTDNTKTITIGNFGGGFNFPGSMDEVRVWNVARTATEIDASKGCELEGTESGLLAYYKFNQGLAALNNTSITTAIGTVGGNPTLNNFTKNGLTSNFLAGSPIRSNITCAALSTSDFAIENNLKLYPNPTNGLINIDYNELTNPQLEVYDINGRILLSQKLNNTASQIDVANYPLGVYLFKITSEEGTTVSKVVKQ